MSLLFGMLGRPDAETVVREHGPQVFRHLKRIFGPKADVDDAYQMVFVEVIRSLPSFAGRARLSTWIRRITWNVAYQEMRLRYRQEPHVSFDEATHASKDRDGSQAALEERDAARRLYAALAELEPKQRIALVLHDVEGCTLKEIAEAVGRPLPTVASQLAAGRARLASLLTSKEAPRGQVGDAEQKESK